MDSERNVSINRFENMLNACKNVQITIMLRIIYVVYFANFWLIFKTNSLKFITKNDEYISRSCNKKYYNILTHHPSTTK